MSDLIERLRGFVNPDYATPRPKVDALMREAADEIKRLTAALAAQPAQALTIRELDSIARDAQVAFCLGKATSFEVAFARGVELKHGIGSKP